jgi:hypothetical protein
MTMPTFRETYSAIRNAPEAKERQRRKSYKAVALIIFGLPFALLFVSGCEWMHYPRATYFPMVIGATFLLSNLLANCLYDRARKWSAGAGG